MSMCHSSITSKGRYRKHDLIGFQIFEQRLIEFYFSLILASFGKINLIFTYLLVCLLLRFMRFLHLQ